MPSIQVIAGHPLAGVCPVRECPARLPFSTDIDEVRVNDSFAVP